MMTAQPCLNQMERYEAFRRAPSQDRRYRCVGVKPDHRIQWANLVLTTPWYAAPAASTRDLLFEESHLASVFGPAFLVGNCFNPSTNFHLEIDIGLAEC